MGCNWALCDDCVLNRKICACERERCWRLMIPPALLPTENTEEHGPSWISMAHIQLATSTHRVGITLQNLSRKDCLRPAALTGRSNRPRPVASGLLVTRVLPTEQAHTLAQHTSTILGSVVTKGRSSRSSSAASPAPALATSNPSSWPSCGWAASGCSWRRGRRPRSATGSASSPGNQIHRRLSVHGTQVMRSEHSM